MDTAQTSRYIVLHENKYGAYKPIYSQEDSIKEFSTFNEAYDVAIDADSVSTVHNRHKGYKTVILNITTINTIE